MYLSSPSLTKSAPQKQNVPKPLMLPTAPVVARISRPKETPPPEDPDALYCVVATNILTKIISLNALLELQPNSPMIIVNSKYVTIFAYFLILNRYFWYINPKETQIYHEYSIQIVLIVFTWNLQFH
jgi:hypothetical protein